jgi:hypothetical protein
MSNFGVTGSQVKAICSGTSGAIAASQFEASSPAVFRCVESVFFPETPVEDVAVTAAADDQASLDRKCPRNLQVCAAYARSNCGAKDSCCLAGIWAKCLENYPDKTVLNWGCRFGYEDLNQAALTCSGNSTSECALTDSCVDAALKEVSGLVLFFFSLANFVRCRDILDEEIKI